MKTKIIVLVFLLSVLGCDSKNETQKDVPPNTNKIASEGKILTLGSVSVKYKYEEEVSRPVLQYLASELSEYGYTGAKSVIVSSLDELIKKANNNEIDIFFGSLYPTITVDKNSKLKPELKSTQNGTDNYSSVFFTNDTSKLSSLENINGHMIAFENNYSTSGYIYPSTILKKMGYNLLEFKNPADNVPLKNVGYSFSMDDANTFIWVMNGYVDIGVSDSELYEYFSQKKINKLKVIHRSKKLLKFITSIRSDIEPDARKQLINVLLNMQNNPKAKELFLKLMLISKFETLDQNYYSEIKNDFEQYLLK